MMVIWGYLGLEQVLSMTFGIPFMPLSLMGGSQESSNPFSVTLRISTEGGASGQAHRVKAMSWLEGSLRPAFDWLWRGGAEGGGEGLEGGVERGVEGGGGGVERVGCRGGVGGGLRECVRGWVERVC